MEPTTKPSESPAQSESGSASVEQQLQAALEERDSNRERWLRAQAELENFRKRVQREASEEHRYRVLSVVRDILPALDNLERAVDAAKSSDDLPKLVQGVQLVIKQVEDILARHSVKPIPAVGQPFDPHLHQAIQQVPTTDHPPMTIVTECQRGYTLHDRVVRPSVVIVAAAPDGSAPATPPAPNSADSGSQPGPK